MTAVRLVETAPPHHDRFRYHAPQFEVKIEGAGLPRDVLRDVIQLSYHDSVAELDGFELTVNNWDPARRRFKYVGAETDADLQGTTDDGKLFKLFEPCNKEVQLSMGYVNALQLMLTGSVTTMEPHFPATGGPTLTVRGLNVLHTLRRKPYTTVWENKKDSEIAENLATLRDPDTHAKRFPLPIDINRRAKGREHPTHYVMQHDQTDIEFLLMRARLRGYVVFVRQNAGSSNRRLYFGPADQRLGNTVQPTQYELAWGRSIVEFKATLTTANQVKSVTVNGWDRRRNQAITEKVTIDDASVNRNRDLRRLLDSCDPREEVVVSEPVFTSAQARDRATAILLDRQRALLKASVTVVGVPDLRAGQIVNFTNLGARFSGSYFITDTNHTIDDSGYLTRFNAQRLQGGGGGAGGGGGGA